jgi:hypothetical protein
MCVGCLFNTLKAEPIKTDAPGDEKTNQSLNKAKIMTFIFFDPPKKTKIIQD